MNLEQYLPVILFILVGVGVGVVPQVLGFLLGPRRPDAAKNSPYECGFEAFEDARMKFDVRYYLVAILFILFDLEIAFLFPWAVSLREIGATGFWAMMIFLGILVVGFVYEWKKGALDWERSGSAGAGTSRAGHGITRNTPWALKAYSRKASSPRAWIRSSTGPRPVPCGR
jgi:NADH-quinone oxidoreductase subunit A